MRILLEVRTNSFFQSVTHYLIDRSWDLFYWPLFSWVLLIEKQGTYDSTPNFVIKTLHYVLLNSKYWSLVPSSDQVDHYCFTILWWLLTLLCPSKWSAHHTEWWSCSREPGLESVWDQCNKCSYFWSGFHVCTVAGELHGGVPFNHPPCVLSGRVGHRVSWREHTQNNKNDFIVPLAA